MDGATVAYPHVNVIFDFDKTIFPDETTLCLARKVAEGNHLLEKFLLEYKKENKTVGEKLSDFKSFILLISKINKLTLREFIEEAERKIDPIFPHLMSDLEKNGVRTHVISSGYMEIVSSLAGGLGIPSSQIAANNFIWARNQAIFVAPSVLHGVQGKVKIIKKWRASGKINGPIIMVGDGQADRNVYLRGLATGFVQANYYTESKEYNQGGNYLVCDLLENLQEKIFKLIINNLK